MIEKNRLTAFGIAAALVLTIWLCWYFSDRQAVRRQLVGLSWEMSKKSRQESTMETALKMREVKAALSPVCRVIVPEAHFDDALERDMAVMYLMHYRDRYELIAVSFEAMRIDFPAKGEAAVQGTVAVRRQGQQAAPSEISAQVRLVLRKQDGSWLLTQAELPAALIE